MKLYATVTSERASKSQGGNDYIEVELSADRLPAGRIILDKRVSKAYRDECYSVIYIPVSGINTDDGVILAEFPTIAKKGEKQKGECLNNECRKKRMSPCNYCEEHLRKMGFVS